MSEAVRNTESARTVIVRLSPKTQKALRIRVAEEDTSIQKWLEALIERELGIGRVERSGQVKRIGQDKSSRAQAR